MRLFRSALVAIAMVAACGHARACGSGAEQFSDDFKTPDAGWGAGGDKAKIGNGMIRLLPAVNGAWWLINPPLLFTEADICVTVKTGALADPTSPVAGVIFWATDASNFYHFSFAPSGRWVVSRHVGSRWINVTSGTSQAVKPGTDAVNEVEVRTTGNAGEAYLNGTKAISFHGQPPDGGGAVGLYAESEDKQASIWDFTGIKVLKLP